jgi:protein TonB
MFMLLTAANRAVPSNLLNQKVMEPKKNPKYDVHAQRGTIFQISLTITLALVIMAFQWRVPIEKELILPPLTTLANNSFDELIPTTSFKTEEPPKARELKPTRPIAPTEFIVASMSSIESEPSTPVIDQGETLDNSLSYGAIDLAPEISGDSVFVIVEKMPEPIGGYKGFYEGLSVNMKYPKRASRDGVAGKVYISFVVNEKSELSDFKVLKGIGYGCDEEAIRVIALSKWNAGKQRGKPVKVRMVQTINFRLN